MLRGAEPDPPSATDRSRHPSAPLIVHVIHRLDTGGLENGLVNLINHIPAERYRHAIVCLKDYSDFRRRIARDDVEVIALHRREGKDPRMYLRLFRTLRKLSPDIVHTRNLATLEAQLVAFAAGVPLRVHGEHGRDMGDLLGQNRKYNLLRKLVRPFVGRYVTVSKDLRNWIIATVGAADSKVRQIYNGVDSERFHPRRGRRADFGRPDFFAPENFVIGSAGRMAEVKDFPTLVRAFLELLARSPAERGRLRLLIVGDGVARSACMALLQQAGAADLAWFPGERSDVPELMRAMDVFVLPSLAEGISNTILEAMATGLPVVATAVGGNVELVQPGRTGALVPPRAPVDMAAAIAGYYLRPALRHAQGLEARLKVRASFSTEAMVNAYLDVYDSARNRQSTPK